MLHSCISAAIALLPVVLTLQQCYVCKSANDDGHTELEFQFPGQHIEGCKMGVTPSSKECPPKYKGCLTQYSGEHVSRSCSELKITECKKANRVDYCYCQGNLCNLDETLDNMGPTLPEDDEDEGTEGSGSRETAPISRTTQSTSPATTRSAQNMPSRGEWQQSPLKLFSFIFPPLLVIYTKISFS